MNNKPLNCLKLILTIGVVLCLVVCLTAGVIKTPNITEHDFNYAATYQMDGETKTVEGVYSVQFVSTGDGTDPHYRYYVGHYLSDPTSGEPENHIIAEKDGLVLRVVFIFNDGFLMGDGGIGETYDDAIPQPYLAAYDNMGVEYSDMETLEKFGAELISWELPQPIENSFRFSGIVMLYSGSMLLMLLVGILAIIACMIFVKRDKTIPYTALDKVSIAFNFLVAFVALPIMTLVVTLMPIYVSGDELLYKLDLCIPAITTLSLAVSLALRRIGCSVTGFCVQFIGSVLFTILAVLESVMPI